MRECLAPARIGGLNVDWAPRCAKAIIAAFACLTLTVGIAAAQVTPEQTARNLEDFDWLVAKIEANYAGYETKTKDGKADELAALTEQLRASAGTASDQELTGILAEWLAFFKDGHIGLDLASGGANEGAPIAPILAADRFPDIDWSEEAVQRALKALGRRRDPIEGIWRISGDAYRVAILRTDKRGDAFAAVILSAEAEGWSPGEVKALIRRTPEGGYQSDYAMRDRSIRNVAAALLSEGVVLDFASVGPAEREWPAVADPWATKRAFPSGEMFLQKLSQDTLWLRLPDFNGSRAEPLNALFEKHKADLASTANLIIDARNNGGGSDFVYAPVIDLLYTRPIYTVGVQIKASPDNIELRKAVLEEARSIPEAADVLPSFERQIARMEENVGGFISGGSSDFSIETRDATLPNPKRVAVLIDGAGSSGEQFLLEAMQSRKVTMFGKKNPAGVLDFANVVGMTSPTGRFEVYWATSRSLRLPGFPVDPDGIAPDIRIPESEEDPVTFAQRWLERQVD